MPTDRNGPDGHLYAVTARRPRRRTMVHLRSRRLATIVTTALILAGAPVITAGRASAAVPNPALQCQPESFPPAGTPRNAPGKPFSAPFAATLNGGFLSVHNPNALAGVTFGVPEPQLGYPMGTLFGEACGLLTLPSLKGPITDDHPGAPDGNPQYNHNFILFGPPGVFDKPPLHSIVPPGYPVCDFRYKNSTDQNPTTSALPGSTCDLNQPVPVGLTIPGTALPVLEGYGSAAGVINTAILSPAAANGGLNVSFTNTAKATAVLNPADLVAIFGGLPANLLPPALAGLPALIGEIAAKFAGSAGVLGGECTLAVGNLSQTGLPGAPVTPPVSLSSENTGGKPVTGPASSGTQAINPMTAGGAVAAANDFPAPAVDPNMPPDPGAPNAGMPPTTLCNTMVADVFNLVLGLPAPAGDVTFMAPVGFSAHAPQ
ncbi:MAG: hypothetical protein ACR2MN_09765 [Acidimicrobiales bacterium]